MHRRVETHRGPKYWGVETPWCPRYQGVTKLDTLKIQKSPKYPRVETPRCPKHPSVKTLQYFVSQNSLVSYVRGSCKT